MDSDDLKTFIAVHRSGGFSHAAASLGRSQPAISRRIALLEDELRLPLFERVPGRAMLSQAGRLLLPYAERVLAALQDAEQALRALATEEAGPVSLAVVGTLAGTDLAAALKLFAESHPKVDLRLRTASSNDVSDLVRVGDVEIGLRYILDPSEDLECEEIGAERLIVACAKRHRWAGRSIARLAQLRAEKWLAFPVVAGRREIAASHIFALFLAHGLGEVDWTPVDSLTAQKRLVEAGFGIALLPESSVAEELSREAMSAIRVGDLTASRPIVAVTRRGGYLSLAGKRLVELLRERYAAS